MRDREDCGSIGACDSFYSRITNRPIAEPESDTLVL